MEITIINEYRVDIALTDAELKGLGVPFEELDYGRLETRRALWTLLGELRGRGVSLRPVGKVLFEARRTDGGCVLAVSVLPPRGDGAPCVRQLVRSPKLPAAFTAETEEALARAAALLGPEVRTELLRWKNRSYLYAEGDCAESRLLAAEAFADRLPGNASLFRAAAKEYGESF